MGRHFYDAPRVVQAPPTQRPAGWRLGAWFTLVVLVLGACAIGYFNCLPLAAAHWLGESTRRLVALGPPLAFSYGEPSMVALGMVGALVSLTAARCALFATRVLAAVSWALLAVLAWLVFGLFAAAPMV